ncbi:PemK-like, MazF-like toxin of type II toxin-antitoxin system [Geodermatophilus ruber]|uniref:PemK-like, MazF-like toxin of type II toxin-antitoxin system n=2 Tax=Geodermatophilus ruber TaxID=504800 RepID=A0A1I4DAW2_9ACTN|nr:PemK-like, MazF-like toxin of type II toxin-antitoxin system [Geodermatophilus ruber]
MGRRLTGLLRTALRPRRPAPGREGPVPAREGAAPAREGATPARGGVRDLSGGLGGADLAYRPHPDKDPDPGEVVWAWVPFDEGDGRGKDRPVLVVGRRDADLLGLMLSSQDHDRDADDEARHGRIWIDVGSGAWDPRGRPSEARLDRLLLVPPGAARRAGAALDRRRFDEVVRALRRVHGG